MSLDVAWDGIGRGLFAVLRRIPFGRLIRMTTLAAACAAAAGCSSTTKVDENSEWFSKPADFFATPDWLKNQAPRNFSLAPKISPDDLMTADGRCAGMDAAPSDESLSENSLAEKPASPAAVAPLSGVEGGIALGMSECEVARRAGRPDNFEFGSNERGERALVLTYLGGYRPGIYRFVGGALRSIERGPEPAPAPKPVKPARKPKPRVAAKPRPAPPAAQRRQAAPQQQQQRQQQPQARSSWPSQPAQPRQAPWPGQARPAASPWPGQQQSSSAPSSSAPWPSQAR
jgi:hypothetical protein